MATEEELSQVGIVLALTADGKARWREGLRATEGTYTTEPAKDPAQIDFLSDKNGKPSRRIYKVEKDTLTICGAEGDGDRPTKFESPAGTRIMLLTFKRVEKKK